MKITTTAREIAGKPMEQFPKIMRSKLNGIIILALRQEHHGGPYSGVVVHPGSNNVSYVGEQCDCWNHTAFEDFQGIVTLQSGY